MPVFEFAGGGSSPHLHPERKGQLNKSPKKNWVEKSGGLPTYINSIATALKRENPSWSTSRAIQTAVNAVKKMCATGRAFNGKAQVSSAVRTAACNAVASWNAKKAGASEVDDSAYELADNISTKPWSQFKESDYTDEQFISACLIKGDSKSTSKFPVREPDGTLNKNGVHAAASRASSGDLSPDQIKSLKSKLRGLYSKLGETPPESINMSDEDYMINVLELSEDEIREEVEIDLDADKYLEMLNLSAAEQMSLRLPVYDLEGDASERDDGLMEKEILRTGVINYKGNKVEFTKGDLEAAEQNFHNNAVDYVPFQLGTDDNKHSDSPKMYGGTMENVRRSDDGTKLYGSFRLTDEVKNIVKHNPKFGVSVKLHPNYVRSSDEKSFGPTLLHVAGVHRPRLTGMTPWQSISASIDDDADTTINLADEGEFEEEEVVKTPPVENVENNDDVTEGGIKIMAENGEAQTLTNDQLQQMITNAVTTAVADYKTENENLKNQVTSLSESISKGNEKNYEQAVKTATASYKQDGVPPAIVDLAENLMLSFDKDERNSEIELSEGEGDNATTNKYNRVQLITKLLDETKGYIDFSSEEGTTNDGSAEFSEADDAAVDFLLNR